MTWRRWLRRHLLSQKARTTVAVIAVVVGVAVYVGVALGTRAVIQEIDAGLLGEERVVELEAIGFGSGAVDGADLERIESLDGVLGIGGTGGSEGLEQIGAQAGGAAVTVFLEPDVERDAWLTTNADDLVPLRAVDRDRFRSDSVEFFESIERSLAPMAGAALVVSGFIIYLTMSRTVGDRRVTFGTMRALGATRRSVVGSVLGESAVIGVLGSALGVALGHAMGPGIGSAMGSGFGVAVGATGGVSLTPAQWIVAIAGGVLTPPVAAAIPAWRAASIEPAMAITEARDDAVVSIRRGVAGLVLYAVGAIAAFTTPGDAQSVGVAIAMIGVLFGVPLLIAPAATLIRRMLLRIRPGAVDIAAAQVGRRRGRTAVTIGLVTGTLALLAVVQAVIASQRPAFVDAVNTNLGADVEVFVDASQATDLLARFENEPAVAAVTPLWRGSVDVVTASGSTGENLKVIDPATYFDVAGFTWVRGTDPSSAVDALRMGGAALVSTNIADEARVRVGEFITVRTVAGPVELTVAGVYYGFAYGESDAVIVARGDGETLFGTGPPESVLVDLAPGETASLSGAGAALVGAQDWFSVGGGSFGLSPSIGLRQSIIGQFDDLFGLVNVLAVLVALLGLVGMGNTLTMEVLDRRHEFGVLRALGLHRRQVIGLVMAEGAFLALVASVLAVALGTVLGWAMADAGAGGVSELSIALRFPMGPAVALVASATLLGALVSLLPGRAAARVSPTELLRAAD